MATRAEAPALATAGAHFALGHVLRDPATGAVAVRTGFDALQFPNMAWLIATPNMGAANASHEDVAGWADLYTPPAPVAGTAGNAGDTGATGNTGGSNS